MQTYESPPRTIVGWRRVLVVPAAIAALVFAAGVVGSLQPRPSEAAPTPSAWTAPAGVVDTGPQVDCGKLPTIDCVAAINAARNAVADAQFRIVSMRAWPTLMCGDDRDCPLLVLEATTPVGSVAVTFEDRGVAWVNVFREAASSRLDDTRDVFSARVIRWFRAP